SFLVAALGLAGSVAIGFAAAAWLLPDAGTLGQLLLAGAIGSTSIGITARVFDDLGRSASDEARVILGAAVIDDVLGLILLAAIVGAFAAGVILEEADYRELLFGEELSLEQHLHPIASFLVPVFFVLIGLRTDLGAFAEPGALALAAVLSIAAIVGKQLCML